MREENSILEYRKYHLDHVLSVLHELSKNVLASVCGDTFRMDRHALESTFRFNGSSNCHRFECTLGLQDLYAYLDGNLVLSRNFVQAVRDLYYLERRVLQYTVLYQSDQDFLDQMRMEAICQVFTGYCQYMRPYLLQEIDAMEYALRQTLDYFTINVCDATWTFATDVKEYLSGDWYGNGEVHTYTELLADLKHCREASPFVERRVVFHDGNLQDKQYCKRLSKHRLFREFLDLPFTERKADYDEKLLVMALFCSDGLLAYRLCCPKFDTEAERVLDLYPVSESRWARFRDDVKACVGM